LIDVKSGKNIDVNDIATQVTNLRRFDVNPGQKAVIIFAIDASMGSARRNPIEAAGAIAIGSSRYDLLFGVIRP